MKNNKGTFYKTILFLVIITIVGCSEEYFETQPDNLLSTESIFENRQQTERWWGGLFTSIPDIWNMPYGFQFSHMADELDSSQWTNPAINSGALSPSNQPSQFEKFYESIRKTSIFLQNIDNNEEIRDLQDGEQIIAQYKGEARFLRAYYYWELMRRLGPVVILPLEPSKPEDNFQIPRSTWDECVAFVLSELDQAKQTLPIDYFQSGTQVVDGTEVGRINRMIVEAVESQILLYHASPLYNGNNQMTDFTNLDGTQLLNSNNDATRWGVAATAAKEAIDMAHQNGKSLFKVSDSDSFTAAFLSVRNLFWDGWSTEGIWIRPSTNNWYWEVHSAPRGVSGTPYNGMAVVQRLVDDFRMSNGESVQQSNTYTEEGFTSSSNQFYGVGTSNMYVGREARFYANITFNGSVMPGKAKAGEPYVEFYNNGNSGKKGSPRDWPKTGYTARKNMHPTFSLNPAINVNRPAMNIRLAELYLNYAEALNESDPGNLNIIEYLNRIRSRAGQPDLLGGIGQSKMRELIRLERRVEFCFEAGHRFFDVRRWMIADKPGSNQGGDFYGMNMEAGTVLSSPEFHQRTKAIERAPWQRRYYFFPYGQNEADRNSQLIQFPGY